MIVRNIQDLSLRLSPILHVLLVEDYGPISSFMNYYVDFLRNYTDEPENSRRAENAMATLYIGLYEYLAEDQDRSVALLHHLQETSIEFYNGDLSIGKIEVKYEEETV
tara:strand:- start:176 stop:499 length:324 start_codon:yes stop_codon:yes gene_type:complete